MLFEKGDGFLGTKFAAHMGVAPTRRGWASLSEDEILEGIYKGHEAIKKIVEVQKRMIAELGRERREVPTRPEPAGLRERLTGEWKERLADAMRIRGKLDSYARVADLKDEMLAGFAEDAIRSLSSSSRVRQILPSIHKVLQDDDEWQKR